MIVEPCTHDLEELEAFLPDSMCSTSKDAAYVYNEENRITAKKLYAELYDLRVSDWEGEIDFYRELIANSHLQTQGVLEIACGTGRVTMQLAEDGIEITGLDISPELLEIARAKSVGIPNVSWVLDDMKAFEIGKRFGYIFMPGHSFQFMNTPDEQVQCLEQIKRHLVIDGLLVIHIDHQDVGWLAGLPNNQEELVYQKGPILTHPATSQQYCQDYAWSFEPSTQTATVRTNWEQISENGTTAQVWEMEPAQLHCVYPFEIEHLLKRAGFSIEAVYGDFSKNKLMDDAEDMIWLARKTK
ncbi:MAG: class I SAM-dependent methyltransferase [Chloroflexi bacterium]|nr:class I SAM-dependent methyltransferase [Chloroflexota bacterium]